MSDATPFLAEILAAPDDDGPRLTYADWLEQAGEVVRSEFIRIGVALARVPADSPQWQALRSRELNLVARHPELRNAGLPNLAGLEWHTPRRGFVQGVTVSRFAAFERNVAGLLADHPIDELHFPRISARNFARLMQSELLAGIRRLQFSNCKLGDAGMLPLFTSGHLSELRVLGLVACGIQSPTMERIAAWPQLERLEAIDLSENVWQISDFERLLDSRYWTETIQLRLSAADVNRQLRDSLLTRLGKRLRFRHPPERKPSDAPRGIPSDIWVRKFLGRRRRL